MRFFLVISVIFAIFLCLSNAAFAQKKEKRKKKKHKTEQVNPSISGEAVPADTVKPIVVETPKPTNTVGKPNIKFDNEVYNFGKINQGELIKYSFNFLNTGTADLTITNVKPSCGCTIPEWPKEAIKPGQTAQINVKFNSAGKMGFQKKSITVTTNLEPNQIKYLYLEGEVLSPTLPK